MDSTEVNQQAQASLWESYLPSTGPDKDPGCSTVNANSPQWPYSFRAHRRTAWLRTELLELWDQGVSAGLPQSSITLWHFYYPAKDINLRAVASRMRQLVIQSFALSSCLWFWDFQFLSCQIYVKQITSFCHGEMSRKATGGCTP